MKIVIDILDGRYEELMTDDIHLDVPIFKEDIIATISKGHGRIADMDEAIKCIEECEGEDAIWAISLIEWACSKRTLIKADEAESGE